LTRIGILGGTFNPPHLGHLICAQEALVELELDHILMMPAGLAAHKQLSEDPGRVHRLELCRRAVSGDSRFVVSDLEMRRDGPSYTVDTLSALQQSAPDNELYLIVGGDVAAGLGSWRSPERVLASAALAIASRSGTSRAAIQTTLAGIPGGDRAQFFGMPPIGISSTDIGARVQRHVSIRYLVPDAVAAYIDENHLYGS
jgi:nicotinate-nucleotide adenylyltransferase